MKIHEVIRKYRKERNLTQEQLAVYLGVTAPAVNKWESGASYPDITLLAPLARILEIDMDTLLSFREDLTDEEINRYTEEVAELVKQDGFAAGFERSAKLIKEYSGSEKLILYLAQMLQAYHMMLPEEEGERYEPRIHAWLWQIAKGKDAEMAALAASGLCSVYASKGDFKKAQELLDQVPLPGYDKRPMQGMLYQKQGKREEAQKLYEQMLFQSANQTVQALQEMLTISCKEKDYQKAQYYAELTEDIAKRLELGAYISATPGLLVAVEQQDTDKTLYYLEQMVDGISRITDHSGATLYSHLTFRESKNKDVFISMIRKGLSEDKELEFLSHNPRFEALKRKLETNTGIL